MKRICLINKILLKSFVVALVCSMLCCGITCSATDVLQGSLEMPSQVEKERLFTVNLKAQCSSKLSVVMFEIEYSDNVEYKDAVSSSDDGTVLCSGENNTINIMYINALGVDVSKPTTIAQATFKAGDTPSDVKFKVYTEYSTSYDEQELDEGNTMEYTVEIVEKITDNSNPTDNKAEDSTKKTDEKPTHNNTSDNSVDDENLIATPTEGESLQEGSENTPTEKTSTDLASVNNHNNNTIIFIAGGLFALTVVVVVFISYRLGKKQK